ncbi:zinc finger protein 32-like isoform X2 [Mercenaria mercenaria]|uniref:zinc finger protein 32-like isoform X2 n=1 Tax=Mercenaria mercenaria TaxID=6596 RepID=UPI001E1D564B|nr:zinc finger protein 32-like isoform X2 [Mercenaria mercenaria]
MEEVPEEELEESHFEQVIVKQEVVDEGYMVAVTDKEVCNTVEHVTDISSIARSTFLSGNNDFAIAKSDLDTETPAENVKHEIEIEKTVSVKTEPDVNESNETLLNTAVNVSLTDGKIEEEQLIEKDVEEELHDDASTAYWDLFKDSAEKEDQWTVQEKKGYMCEICKKTFTKKSSLSSHEITHTEEKPFKCQFCDKGFNVRSNLNVHLRIHTGQRPHTCEICQKTFRQSGSLRTHERIHKGEKPYTCNLCTRSFRSSSAVIIHQRTHTGERPFRCDICSRSFTTSTSLKTHRITHSGTMLYDCPLCGRQFNRRNNLNVHIKRHNKNRKFSCPQCSNGFVMRAHLSAHLRRAHKINIPADQLNHFEVLDDADDCNVETEQKLELDVEMKTENVCDDSNARNNENEVLDIKDEN